MLFLVLNATSIQVMVFWAVTQCSLVEGTNVSEETAASIPREDRDLNKCLNLLQLHYIWGL
jgi:hypothetical protein